MWGGGGNGEGYIWSSQLACATRAGGRKQSEAGHCFHLLFLLFFGQKRVDFWPFSMLIRIFTYCSSAEEIYKKNYFLCLI